jgi:DNA (cytosine-5)-methyltransferase 1
VAVVEKEPEALAVYKQNFEPAMTYPLDITRVIDGAIGSEPTASELQMRKDCFSTTNPLSLLLAGPPCQGYSSLNHHTRQNDHRNIFYDTLYERVARFIELYNPESVLVENVPMVVHSKQKVVEKSIALIEKRGYFVDSDVVNLAEIGVPQIRKRHVVVASKRKEVSISGTIEKHRVNKYRSFEWAAGDLQNEPALFLMNTPTKHSKANMRRIEYLHLNGKYNLPNRRRPKCHHKKHGFKSMYGRMRLDEPAQTVTSGFRSPGQGRFIHPTKLRTITPHEAARLQFIPDYFDFSKATTRSSLSLMIGNAAPMKLSYVFCLELLT